MNKFITRENVEELLESCYINGIGEENCDIFSDNINWGMLTKLGVDVDILNGATKLVIVPSTDDDKVLKIPFFGQVYIDEEYDEEYDEYDYTEEFVEFCGANSEYGNNYCEAEEKLYEKAEDAGLGFLFAKTEFAFTVNDMPIYTQEKCTPMPWGLNYDVDRCANVEKYCSKHYYHCFNVEWLIDVIDTYGARTFIKLMKFIESEGVDDLHNGNIGYRNGKPIIMDYAGFNS